MVTNSQERHPSYDTKARFAFVENVKLMSKRNDPSHLLELSFTFVGHVPHSAASRRWRTLQHGLSERYAEWLAVMHVGRKGQKIHFHVIAVAAVVVSTEVATRSSRFLTWTGGAKFPRRLGLFLNKAHDCYEPAVSHRER